MAESVSTRPRTTLGGNVCIRNGLELDYCFREAIESLLPVCDEVVVCDGESTDGTQELLRAWAEREPKIRLCVYPWKHPKGDLYFWVDWLNYAREHVTCDYHIQLDADEILHESGYDFLRWFKSQEHHKPVSFWCHRLNFWKDSKSLIPHGVCCSHRVIRVGPQNVWMPSDGPDPRGTPLTTISHPSDLVIGHYGFLRKRDSFFAKARALQSYFFDHYDPRLEQAEQSDGNWMEDIKDVEWTSRLIPFRGSHPELGVKWLRDRNYAV